MNNNLKVILGTIAGVLIGGMTVVIANQTIQALQNTGIKISLNGEIQEFKDETTGEKQYPITYNSRTYLPLRNVAQLSGLEVDYDNKSNTALLTKNAGINEIDISKGGEHSTEYINDLQNRLKNIKQSLVNSGRFVLSAAHDSNTDNDYFKYWGTSYRYGGGIEFFDNDTFFYSVGIWADTLDRSGTYIIDMYNNKIIYRFANGMILEGTYKLENNKITEVSYIESGEYLEDGPIYVTLRAQTEDEILKKKIQDSFVGNWQLSSAYKNKQEYGIEDYYTFFASGWIYDFKFPNNDNLMVSEANSLMYSVDTKEKKIWFSIANKEGDIASEEEIGDASSFFYYELDENNEINKVIYVENENKENELKLIFTKSNGFVYGDNGTYYNYDKQDAKGSYTEYFYFFNSKDVYIALDDYTKPVDLYGSYGGPKNTNYKLEGTYKIDGNTIKCHITKMNMSMPTTMEFDIDGEVTLELQEDKWSIKLIEWSKKPVVINEDFGQTFDVSIGKEGTTYSHATT